MLGKFEMILVNTERTESKDGKETYLYANLLQGSEVKRVRVEDLKQFEELIKLGELKKVSADIDVSVKTWQGSTYVNYKLIDYKTLEEKQQSFKKA